MWLKFAYPRLWLWGTLSLGIVSTLSSSWAAEELLTFDELPATTRGLSIPNGYQYLVWSNFYYADGLNFYANPSGYSSGVVSPNQVAFLVGAKYPGTTASIGNAAGFDFISGYLTAAWRDGLQVRVIGYSGTDVLYDNTYTLNTSGPTFIPFNYYGVTQVIFTSSGGTHNAAFSSDGYHFLMDNVTVSVAQSLTPELAGAIFDQLWSTFDRDYAMFVLHPEVDWNASRDTYRPLATNCASVDSLAGVFVQMLQPLEDLHVWLTVSGEYVATYDPALPLNANPAAFAAILGTVNRPSSLVQWAVTSDKIGFIAINSWTDSTIPGLCEQALEQMRDTRGLVIDVRANGGGSENLAMMVADRFLCTNFAYAYYQVRNGTNHTDLTDKTPRTISPRGPWRYDRPVILLIGQNVASSDESFVGMMTGATNVMTMGDHTCGASGNPETVQLALDMTVTVSTWIDYLPDGTLLEGHGFQPQLPFIPGPGAFIGNNDTLLSAALERLRPLPLPAQPILGPVFSSTLPLTFDDLIHKQAVPSPYGGLTWSNFYAYNAQIGVTPAYGIPMLSAPNVIYNGWGGPALISASTPFDLISAEVASVFYTDVNLEIKGYNGSTLAYDRNFTLSAITPSTLQLDCYGVTSVLFISSGGTLYRTGGGEQISLDDLVIVPHSTAPVQPLLQNLKQAGGSTSFNWSAQAGQTYQIQYTSDLLQANWLNLGTPLTTGNYTLSCLDSCTNGQRFYRVAVLP